jgi:hypothetical protein
MLIGILFLLLGSDPSHAASRAVPLRDKKRAGRSVPVHRRSDRQSDRPRARAKLYTHVLCTQMGLSLHTRGTGSAMQQNTGMGMRQTYGVAGSELTWVSMPVRCAEQGTGAAAG